MSDQKCCDIENTPTAISKMRQLRYPKCANCDIENKPTAILGRANLLYWKYIAYYLRTLWLDLSYLLWNSMRNIVMITSVKPGNIVNLFWKYTWGYWSRIPVLSEQTREKSSLQDDKRSAWWTQSLSEPLWLYLRSCRFLVLVQNMVSQYYL